MVEKVGYTRPVTTARGVKKTGGVSGAGFADALSAAEAAMGVGGVDATEGVQSVAAVSSVGALLGAQEVSEQEVRKKRSIKKAGLTIGALENLRDALLIGTLPISTLTRLETMVAEERLNNDDPVLQGILDEIELRAAVELAKLEVAGLLNRYTPARPEKCLCIFLFYLWIAICISPTLLGLFTFDKVASWRKAPQRNR